MYTNTFNILVLTTLCVAAHSAPILQQLLAGNGSPSETTVGSSEIVADLLSDNQAEWRTIEDMLDKLDLENSDGEEVEPIMLDEYDEYKADELDKEIDEAIKRKNISALKALLKRVT